MIDQFFVHGRGQMAIARDIKDEVDNVPRVTGPQFHVELLVVVVDYVRRHFIWIAQTLGIADISKDAAIIPIAGIGDLDFIFDTA